MKVLIFDTETTDVNEPEVIEAAWMRPDGTGEYSERFLPSKKISLGAMATHHIVHSDLVSCRPSASFALPSEVQYLVGHNVDFDWKATGSPDVKKICTLALCRWLFPELDSHSQSAMLYHFFPEEEAREMCRGAHNALSDVNNCRLILDKIRGEMQDRGIQVNTWGEFHEISEKARIPIIMSFGKHKGTKVADLPWDYKAWLLRQPDIDPYLVKALRGDENNG